MVYKWFYIRMVLRIIFITISSVLLSYLIFETENKVTAFSMGIVLVMLVLESIRFMRKGISDLDKLLLSLMNEDFALSFPEKVKKNRMKELHRTLNQIIKKFKDLKIEKENHYRLLETIVESLNVGILAVDDTGHVILLNSSLREQLHIPPISEIDILKSRVGGLIDRLEEIPMGRQILLDWKTGGGIENFLCFRGQMKLKEVKLDFYTVQNVRQEMEKREIESYQRLIRILTHEIMNSVTPIGSLSESLLKMSQNTDDLNQSKDDYELGLETIHRRTKGLYRFVKDYRKMAQVPEPIMEEHDLGELAERLFKLYESDFKEKGIEIHLKISKQNHRCKFDSEQIEQVGVNLIKNAGEAVLEVAHPKVVISVENEMGKHLFKISDNGNGIPLEKQNRIFVPFYSTKKSGSGIGLSISNYMVNKHHSKLLYQTSDSGTSFWFELN